MAAVALAVSIASSLAVIATLFFVMRQTRVLREQAEQMRETVKLGGVAETQTRMFTVSEAFLAHPQARTAFYTDEARLSEDELRLRTICEMLADTFDTMERDLVLAPEDNWDAFVVDLFGMSPTLRAYVRERATWYHPRLVELAQESPREHPGAAGTDP